MQGTHLPSKISSLYGVLYVLEAGDAEVSKVFISTIMDYLVKYLGKYRLDSPNESDGRGNQIYLE